MLSSVVLLLALVSPVSAEVVDAQAHGFSLKYVYDIAKPREAVYRAIADVPHWWDASHSYSGQAGNLSLEARAGGCFCERLPGGLVSLAPIVDQVVALQVKRFTTFVETGRPE